MKRLGRKHRPYYRICAMDIRAPRGGRVIEELGTYDPMIRDTDARAVLDGARIDYWLGVGAQPSEKVKVLIKKYGAKGTHLEQQRAALARLAQSRRRPGPVEGQAKPRQPKGEADEADEADEASADLAAGEPAADPSS